MGRILRFAASEVTEEQIAQRAYEIWQSRGCPEGDSEADWRAAEGQLLTDNSPRRRRPLRRLFNRLRGRAATL